jgi:hypothetical protein
MIDGLGPFEEFMSVFTAVEAAERHLTTDERDDILGLAQIRFQGRMADPRLVAIVNRLCQRTEDASKRPHAQTKGKAR